MSYLNKGQWTNDKNKRKYRHMSEILFPVYEYAAINQKDGRRLENFQNYIEGKQLSIKLIEKRKWNKIK